MVCFVMHAHVEPLPGTWAGEYDGERAEFVEKLSAPSKVEAKD